MRITIGFVLLSLFSTAQAYDPAKHIEYSSFAVKQYNSCIERIDGHEKLSELTDKERHYFSLGSEHEDTVDIISRATNWHFYRANEYLPRNKFFDSTNYRIFHKRVAQVEKLAKLSVNSKFIYYYLGKTIHHIQDMAVPAHTAAIYHANPPFGKRDSFDTYHISQEFYDTFSISNELCEKLVGANKGWYQLLDEQAKRTLAVSSKNIDDTDLSWKDFWLPYNDNTRGLFKFKGFGKYGSLGNTFGKNPAVTEEAYKEFAEKQLTDIIHSTIMGIAKFQREN